MVSAVPHPVKGSLRVIANPIRIDGERPAQAACSPLGADNAHPAGQTHMKLEGLKVVDLSWFLPGPYLTTALADHGAEVIKVEPPDRRSRPPHPAARRSAPRCSSATWAAARRAWCSTSRASRAAPISSGWPARPTCWSESFRPGVAARFGIGYEAVKREESRHRLLLDQRLRPGRRLSRPRRARPRARGHDRRAVARPWATTAGRRSRHSRRRPGERPAWAARRADGAAAPPDHGQGRLHRRLHARGADGLVRQRRRLAPSPRARSPTSRTSAPTGGSAFYRVYDTSDGRQLVLAGQEMKFVQQPAGRARQARVRRRCANGRARTRSR